MADLTQATPRPWQMLPAHITEGQSEIVHPDGWLICTAPSDELATLIVRAVNREPLFDELVDALEAMTQNFKPFTSKPAGAPNSQARLEQESQIEAYTKALAILAKVKS